MKEILENVMHLCFPSDDRIPLSWEGKAINPAIAIPSAISSATHSIIGSIAAGIWRNRKSDK